MSDDELDVLQPARKILRMNENDNCESESMEFLAEESPDLFGSQEPFRQSFESGVGISKGLELENIPRVDISVGSQFPTIQPTRDNQPSNSLPHTVLIDLKTVRENEVPSPYPKYIQDKWDSSHVRLPWSQESRYPVNIEGRDTLLYRWDVITDSLLPLKSLDWTKDSCHLAREIKTAVMKYNKRFIDDNGWSFKALEELLEDLDDENEKQMFYTRILPGIVDLCLLGPKAITGSIPLLTANKSQSVTLSQHQISVLLANAFFSTFPRRNSTYKKNFEYKNYPDINFNRLFSLNMRRPEAHQEKLKTLLAYFRQIIKERPTGLVTFTRQAVKREDLPNWVTNSSNIPTNLLRLCSTGYIEEEGKGMLQVDFANKIIGGGVLGQGLVQEEIRFIICPELIISRLFTEKLEDNEVIFMHGAQQFSKYKGYGDSYAYAGNFTDKTSFDINRRRNTTIVAMDAISFRQDPKIQYEERQLIRELNKAFVGFLPVNKNISRLNGVATGNWGCGAFQGDPQLKFLVQLLACVLTGRKLCYFTFGDKGLVREGWRVYNIIVDKQITVAKLFNVLRTYQNRRQRSQTVFQFIEMKLSPQDGESCSSSQTNGAENYLVDTDDELDFGDKSENKTAGRENGAKKGISAGKVFANKDDDDILSIYKNKEESTNADNNTDTIHHDEVNFEAVNRMEEGRSLDPNTSYSSKETPNGNVDTSRSNIKVQQVMEVIDVETESLKYTLNTSTVQIEVNQTKKAQTKITDFFAK